MGGSTGGAGLEKLASQVEDFAWHDSTDMLLALSDGSLVTFLYPDVVYVDATLLDQTKVTRPMPASSSSSSAKKDAGAVRRV